MQSGGSVASDIKEIVVISGKGGTGKTSLTAAFAALAENAILADCDVDAADLHLILKPEVRETHDFSGGKLARVRSEACIGCQRCAEICRFGAVKLSDISNDVVAKTFAVDPVSCEGCGVCVHFCPVQAIDFEEAINGQWFVSETRFGPMVHAKLGIAEENSGKLVSLIRKETKRIAEEAGRSLVIVDGSPGIGCPVIASISGADLVLVVTEPTLSGQHDLERVAKLTAHFGIATAVCINKWDINPTVAAAIEADVSEKGLTFAGRIGYDPAVTKAQVAGQSIPEYDDGPITDQVVALWQAVRRGLEQDNERKEN
jgi:MinD superfamily P-loop ATPase